MYGNDAAAVSGDPAASFDHHDATCGAGEIRELHEQLVSTCPVAHVDRYGGFEPVSGHEESKQVIAAREDYRSAKGGVFVPRLAGLPPQLPAMEFDGDEHRVWRKVFDGLLSPAAVRRPRLLERPPDITLDGEAEFTGLVGGNLMTIRSMPVRFAAAS